MILKKFSAIFCALLLSSCTSLNLNTDELIRPPALSEEQTQIRDTLSSALGTANITLKYPSYGEYRSAFVFEDITGDDIDDAIIFYEGANNYTRIHVMENTDGEWRSVYDAPGLQANIEFVEFLPMTTSVRNNIMIGWNTSNQYEERSIIIYDYEDGEFIEVFNEDYAAYQIVTRKNSSAKELALLTSPQRSGSVRLIRGTTTGKTQVIGVTYLNSAVLSHLDLKQGNVIDDEPALFVDELLYDGTYATEVISLSSSKISNLMSTSDVTSSRTEETVEEGEEELEEDLTLFEQTIRYEELISQDIDNDNNIEIPHQTPMPGYDEDESDMLYLTTYSSLSSDGDSLIPEQYSFEKLSEGYRVIFPEMWINNVTAKLQPETGEVSFIVFNENLERSTTELLRLRVYSKNDYRDAFELEQYREIGTRGLFDYYAYIPPNINSEYEIDYEDLTQFFSFI